MTQANLPEDYLVSKIPLEFQGRQDTEAIV